MELEGLGNIHCSGAADTVDIAGHAVVEEANFELETEQPGEWLACKLEYRFESEVVDTEDIRPTNKLVCRSQATLEWMTHVSQIW